MLANSNRVFGEFEQLADYPALARTLRFHPDARAGRTAGGSWG
jgi:hypothetical protein